MRFQIKMMMLEIAEDLREKIPKFFIHLSLHLLISAIIIIAWVLGSSLMSGDWPFRHWGNWPLNHGPWRYDFGIIPNPRRDMLAEAFALLIVSVLLSFLTVFLKFNRFTVALFSGSFVAQCLAMYFLYWLID